MTENEVRKIVESWEEWPVPGGNEVINEFAEQWVADHPPKPIEATEQEIREAMEAVAKWVVENDWGGSWPSIKAFIDYSLAERGKHD